MKPRMQMLMLSIALFMLGQGCYGYHLTTNAATDGIVHHSRGPVLFWGLKQARRNTQCPGAVARVKTYMPWWSPFVSLLTIGIATPWRAEYECAVGNSTGVPYGVPETEYEVPPGGYPPSPAGQQPQPGGAGIR